MKYLLILIVFYVCLSASAQTDTAKCLVEDRTAFHLQKIDSLILVVTYKGFEDLIPHIVSCNNHYEYADKFQDPPYSLLIPNSIQKQSFCWGDKLFYVAFNSENYDTSILVYYDFDNTLKDFYFNQLNTGKIKEDTVIINGLTIYKTHYTKGKFEGRVFYDNNRIVMYSTTDKDFEFQLQKSAVSFKFK